MISTDPETGDEGAPQERVSPSSESDVGLSSAEIAARDTGLIGLAMVAGYYRIAADAQQLGHQLALTGTLADVEDIVRGANLLGLKSRIVRNVTAKRLMSLPLPAFVKYRADRG